MCRCAASLLSPCSCICPCNRSVSISLTGKRSYFPVPTPRVQLPPASSSGATPVAALCCALLRWQAARFSLLFPLVVPQRTQLSCVLQTEASFLLVFPSTRCFPSRSGTLLFSKLETAHSVACLDPNGPRPASESHFTQLGLHLFLLSQNNHRDAGGHLIPCLLHRLPHSSGTLAVQLHVAADIEGAMGYAVWLSMWPGTGFGCLMFLSTLAWLVPPAVFLKSLKSLRL